MKDTKFFEDVKILLDGFETLYNLNEIKKEVIECAIKIMSKIDMTPIKGSEKEVLELVKKLDELTAINEKMVETANMELLMKITKQTTERTKARCGSIS